MGKKRESKTFSDLFKDKCSSSSFLETYKNECNVCEKTMAIAERLDSSLELKKEIIHELHLSVEYIESFIDGDCCDYKTTEKICSYLGIEVNSECGKKSSI